MTSRVFCGTCRREIDHETLNFWQGTAWCPFCNQVVHGSFSKVPCWVVAVILFLTIRIGIH